jgi:(1->4)-alpha-D-glucan 1-alpha-D-glucosylmutase
MPTKPPLVPARIPVCTYRIQLNHAFTFVQAAELVPYLQELGVTDVYASPFLMARPGSMHGYDVTDHSRLNPEIGSELDFVKWAERLRARDMGLILDIVPNHMCISDPSNRWWTDVLENGPSSPYAKFFDIDWLPPKSDLENKVLLPILGDQYGRVLERQQITLESERGAFVARYYEHGFPIAPRTWTLVIEPMLGPLKARLGENHQHVLELESILFSLHNLPPRTETDPARLRERRREKEVARRRLEALAGASDEVRRAIQDSLDALNGTVGISQSFDGLEQLLADQPYRLSFWRVASDEINYRRFFDINELAAIRVEEGDVFEAVHDYCLRLMRQGWITGLRIDHVDGLHDPGAYLQQLQAACRGALAEASRDERPPSRQEGPPCYMLVEKILAPNERLRPQWPVHGTTGYDFLNLVNGLFVDRAAAGAITAHYAHFTGRTQPFHDVVYESKKTILRVSMSAELTVLARKLDRISEQHRYSRDFTFNSLYDALSEIIACFPVYRSYASEDDASGAVDDRLHIVSAVRAARHRNPAMSGSLFEFIASLLLREDPEGLDASAIAERRDFVYRFQQLTGPVTAKGVEDTSFYRSYPLSSLNEVGGEPAAFGTTLDAFHRSNEERQRDWPYSMSASSTHDTKRGEDVRARINVLSEMPEEWAAGLQRWSSLNRGFKTVLDDEEVPDANEEYLLYQTLLGAWPFGPLDEQARQKFVARVQEYMNKALKEAKVHTSWINPNDEYDAAVGDFIRSLLDPEANAAFLSEFQQLQSVVARVGVFNSLSQTLLKLTCPGVPDLFQGTESWALHLVDPDNRRPVDFPRLRVELAQLLREAERDRVGSIDRMLAKPDDGRIKLYVTARVLAARSRFRALYAEGRYVPLRAEGPRAENVVAFARVLQRTCVVTVAGRFFHKLGAASRPPLGPAVWADTSVQLPASLPLTTPRDILTDRPVAVSRHGHSVRLPLATLCTALPIALVELAPESLS